ncbi:hypothetical protein HII36_15305 [Nonomuraea sp. NN258]|uniref:CAP domain-containing protein n=1 Tax=Nonomuraea antri TaxID=2730852 RepID=UPI001568E786|nr:CAP domain-containing protein [Nonomuraea antri]NRQ33201.1 hypothetical protein [Nonomuraea antri]
MSALFTGVLIGRLSDDPEPAGHVYLSQTAPPAAAREQPPQQQPRKMQPNAGRIARATPNPTARGKTTVKPTRPPKDQISGYDALDDPTQVLGDQDDGQRVAVIPGLAAKVVSLTNAARAKHGCAPLRVDGRLAASARTHSLEMARAGALTHASPDGASPWDRMERAGYPWGAAENIGNGYATADEAVRGWLDSPDHRKNILDCGLRAIGVGVASGPNGPWWTQDFGTR